MKKCDVTEAIFSVLWHAIIVTWLQNLRFFLIFILPYVIPSLKGIYSIFLIQYHVLHNLFIIPSYCLPYSSTELSPLLWKLVATPSSLVSLNIVIHDMINLLYYEHWTSENIFTYSEPLVDLYMECLCN